MYNLEAHLKTLLVIAIIAIFVWLALVFPKVAGLVAGAAIVLIVGTIIYASIYSAFAHDNRDT